MSARIDQYNGIFQPFRENPTLSFDWLVTLLNEFYYEEKQIVKAYEQYIRRPPAEPRKDLNTWTVCRLEREEKDKYEKPMDMVRAFRAQFVEKCLSYTVPILEEMLRFDPRNKPLAVMYIENKRRLDEYNIAVRERHIADKRRELNETRETLEKTLVYAEQLKKKIDYLKAYCH